MQMHTIDITMGVVEDGHTAKLFRVVASGAKRNPAEETLARLVSTSM